MSRSLKNAHTVIIGHMTLKGLPKIVLTYIWHHSHALFLYKTFCLHNFSHLDIAVTVDFTQLSHDVDEADNLLEMCTILIGQTETSANVSLQTVAGTATLGRHT